MNTILQFLIFTQIKRITDPETISVELVVQVLEMMKVAIRILCQVLCQVPGRANDVYNFNYINNKIVKFYDKIF